MISINDSAPMLDEIELKLNKDRREQREPAQSRSSERQRPSNIHTEDDVDIVQGTGSIEGLGLRASLPQNLGMSVGFHVEGKLWLRWMLDQGALNKAIVITLFERFRWKRTTIDGKNLFPFTGHIFLRLVHFT